MKKEIGCGKLLGKKMLQDIETAIGCGDTYYQTKYSYGEVDYCEECEAYEKGWNDAKKEFANAKTSESQGEKE